MCRTGSDLSQSVCVHVYVCIYIYGHVYSDEYANRHVYIITSMLIVIYIYIYYVSVFMLSVWTGR